MAATLTRGAVVVVFVRGAFDDDDIEVEGDSGGVDRVPMNEITATTIATMAMVVHVVTRRLFASRTTLVSQVTFILKSPGAQHHCSGESAKCQRPYTDKPQWRRTSRRGTTHAGRRSP